MAEEVNHNSKQNKNKKNKKNLILQKKNWDLCFLEM